VKRRLNLIFGCLHYATVSFTLEMIYSSYPYYYDYPYYGNYNYYYPYAAIIIPAHLRSLNLEGLACTKDAKS